MKRIIALLLALVMALGLMTAAFAADEMPDQCAPESANFVVYTSKDTETKYYFEELTGPLLNWSCQLEGDTIVEMLKDVQMASNASASNLIYIPMQNARWFNSKPLEKKLIIDLGGFTLSYAGNQNLFYVQRYGFTLRNGTVNYTCVDGTRNPICFGLSTGQTATTKGDKRFDPVVNLENVHIYNNTEAGGSVFTNFIHGTTVNIKDSVLWNQKWSTFNLSKTKQTKLPEEVTAPWGGPCELTINIEGSTVCSANTYFVDTTGALDPSVDSVKISVKDSTIITNTSKGLVCPPELENGYDTCGQEATINESWSRLLRNATLATGKAYVYGTGGVQAAEPFTDVKEGDWFYTYVRDLYDTKIISGMSATTFAPNGQLTYGQALKLVTLAVGESEQPAVDSHWASGYVNFALDRGWLYNEVNPDQQITREAFCQIAAAAAGIVGQPDDNPFTDTADTSVLALYNAGIINGMSETTFAPNATLTRAQIAKIIFGIIIHK